MVSVISAWADRDILRAIFSLYPGSKNSGE